MGPERTCSPCVPPPLSLPVTVTVRPTPPHPTPPHRHAQYEEEKSKGLMLLDQLDASRHEIAVATSRARDLEGVVAQLEDRLGRDRRLFSEQREELEGQLARTKAALDKSNAQNVALHEDCSLVGQELSELSAKSAARIQVMMCACMWLCAGVCMCGYLCSVCARMHVFAVRFC
jgi:hypothetical protein